MRGDAWFSKPVLPLLTESAEKLPAFSNENTGKKSFSLYGLQIMLES